VLAVTDTLSLVRDGTNAGLSVAFTKPLAAAASVDCVGVDNTGKPIGASVALASGATCTGGAVCTQPVIANGVNAQSVTCMLGGLGDTTEVTIHRQTTAWTGFLTSTFNQ
jgi:hypothetical protein